MKITIISQCRLQIIANRFEIELLNISFENIQYYNEDVIQNFIPLIVDWDLDNNIDDIDYINIEYYFINEDYVQIDFVIDKEYWATKKILEPTVFKLEDVDQISVALKKISNMCLHKIYKSSLYIYREFYYLIVYPLDDIDYRLIGILSEYGELVGSKNILSSIISEHGKCILADDAIDSWNLWDF